MLIRKIVLGVGLSCLVFSFMSPLFAATTSSDDDKDQLIQAITKRTTLLEREVRDLKRQLRQVQTQRKSANTNGTTKEAVSVAHSSQSTPDTRHDLPTGATLDEVNIGNKPAILFLGGTPVVTAPYIGVRTQFDASDLIVNIPSVNEDLRLLQQWQSLENEYQKYGESIPARSFIDLSGKVEAQAIYARPYTGRRTSNIDVTAAELDISARVTPWAGAYLAMKYDNSQTVPQLTSNSRVYIDKAFVTAGDLDRFPLYLTVGQAYPPFGLYSTSMLSAPLTQSLARTKARYAQLGYANANGQGLYGAVYAFNGETATVSPSNRINQAGANIGYKYSNDDVRVGVGGGMIANIADADGMQANGASTGFSGFGATMASEILRHQVPAADVHAELGYGAFGLLGEYIASTRSFDIADMMFNGHGARPQAMHVEGSYSFQAFPRPLSLSVGYQQTMQALALLLPQRRYIAAINASLWRSTIQTLEFRHDINYSAASIASGQSTAVVTSGAAGQTSDMLTAQFGVYF